MQITGKFISSGKGLGTPDYEVTIELPDKLPEVNQEHIMAGDTIWVEKVVPSSEPLPQFLKRHSKVVAHFPLPQQEKKEIEEIKEYMECQDVKDPAKLWDIIRIFNNKINELIIFTQKLEERIKCPLKKR